MRSWSKSWPALAFGALFLSVCGLTWCYERDLHADARVGVPFVWTAQGRDALLTGFLTIVVLVLLLALARRSFPRVRPSVPPRLLALCLGGLTLCAGLTYFYGARGARDVYPHVHDTYHYVLGAKYFAELGYDGLYACTALATTRSQVPDGERARDLATDRRTRVGKLRADTDCERRFTPRRWQEFRADVRTLFDIDREALRGALRDRGYNGTPFHTFVASALTQAIPLSYRSLSLLTLVDVAALCIALAALCTTFGWQSGLLASLLFFCQYVDRFIIIGGSCLRYQWLLWLVLALVWLEQKRHARAGVALALAASLNVFPLLFALPMLLKAAHAWVHTRSLPAPQRRFVAGGALGLGLCFALGAAHADGLGNYAKFAEAMRVHDAAGRAPGFGVGLKYDFLHIESTGGPSAEERDVALSDVQPLVLSAAIFLLLVTLAVAMRLPDAEAALLAGFAALFCLFGPTGYYFAFAALLVLCWHRRLGERGGLAMLALLFALSLPPYVAELTGHHRFFVFNRVVSGAWTLYLVLTLGYLSFREGLLPSTRGVGKSAAQARPG